MLRRSILLSLAVSILTTLSLCTSAALAASPWWQLTSSAAPTDLVPGTGSDEVQEVAIVATGGEFRLTRHEDDEVRAGANLPWDASPEVVQTALEEIYGAGNVEVSEPAASTKEAEEHKHAYLVTFVKELSDRRVTPIAPEFSDLTGASHIVTVSEKTRGVPAGRITLVASNLGDEELSGESDPVRIVDRLPAGLAASAVRGEAGPGVEQAPHLEPEEALGTVTVCSLLSAQEVECIYPGIHEPEYPGLLPPFQGIRVEIALKEVSDVAPNAVNEARVEGGEGVESGLTTGPVAAASVIQPIKADGMPTPFGLEGYELTPENEGGTPDTQAGSHPFQTTFTVSPNKGLEPGPESVETPNEQAQAQFGEEKEAVQTKDLSVNLPQGLIGNPTATPQCSEQEFSEIDTFRNHCPPDTALGVAIVTISHAQVGNLEPVHTLAVPLFNLVPEKGEPARLGFEALNAPVVIDVAVRAGRDYGIVSNVSNITEVADLISSKVIVWGVPGDPRHDISRGWNCLSPVERELPCEPLAEQTPRPFFTLPTSCGGQLQATIEGESWDQAAMGDPLETFGPTKPLETLTGCGSLPFSPSIKVEASASAANVPTALTVHLKVPQQVSENATGLAEAEVRSTRVMLPPALQINPAAAGGLQACSEQNIGFERLEASGEAVFSEETEQERHGEAQPQECPGASKLGKVTITTPLLPEPLTGWVYQATQGANPFGSLLALYVVAEDKNAGVRVRLAGEVKVEGDGQLVATFDQTPQTPFEEFTMELFGDNRAALATTGCGGYKTEGSIEPWSGTAPVGLASEFNVGSACASPGAFAPSFVAGMINDQAGAYSPFTLTLNRKDGEQTLSTIATTMPPGLLGKIAGIPRCGEAEANAGTCPSASQIGHVQVSSGVGSEPITLPEPGRLEDPVYLTGPYGGAPFGLAIVVHPEAGPFNLEENGHPVLVRAKVEVNPSTAQISVASDPMPVRLRGIPVDVRSVEVVIERPGNQPFEFNPTSCSPMSITATIGSSEGSSESVSSPFQAANCANLPFKPVLTIATSGKASKADGASLAVKIAAKPGEANIAKTDLQLPLALPSRLTTLQKACTEAQFDANPADCPVDSNIGMATVQTPVLNVPLRGPMYIVSHGGAAFPDVEIVLEGEGVEIILDGKTNIRKGITYSNFEAVPDAPFSSFEADLPEGPHSILATNLPASAKDSFCGQKLTMPTRIVGQNGAVITQTTNVSVTGCAKVLTRSQKLAAALKTCHANKNRAKRASCEARARKKYGPPKKGKSSSRR